MTGHCLRGLTHTSTRVPRTYIRLVLLLLLLLRYLGSGGEGEKRLSTRGKDREGRRIRSRREEEEAFLTSSFLFFLLLQPCDERERDARLGDVDSSSSLANGSRSVVLACVRVCLVGILDSVRFRRSPSLPLSLST